MEVFSSGFTSSRARPSAVTMLRGALVLSCRKLTAGRVGSLAGYALSKLELMALVFASAARGVPSDTKSAWTFPVTKPGLKVLPRLGNRHAFEEIGPPAPW